MRKSAAKPRKPRLSPSERARIQAIFERLRALDENPKTELDYLTPFMLVVAVVLSAQATDKSVNKATEKLFAVAPTPQAMLALGETRLIPYIAAIGLFRTKARNVIRLSQILVDEYAGEVPLNRE